MMDEISLLRRVRTDVPERAAREVVQGRARLFAAIDEEASTARRRHVVPGASVTHPRRRAGAWAGFTALGATTLAVAIVAVSALGVPGVERGGAEPAAAGVLQSSAAAALRFSDPVVEAGQYLRVQTDALFLARGSATAEGETTGFLESARSELFVPADREGDWVWVQCSRMPAETFGPASEAFAEASADAGSDIWRVFPGGETPSGALTSRVQGADYSALPDDPAELLELIYDTNDAALPHDQALVWIADTLRSGTVPAEYRAVLYQAAALIPGVTITENRATLNGVTGIAVGRVEPERNERQDIVLDPRTGQFLGERQVLLVGLGSDVPAGTVTASTAVTTTVVDSAPTDAGLCDDRR